MNSLFQIRPLHHVWTEWACVGFVGKAQRGLFFKETMDIKNQQKTGASGKYRLENTQSRFS